MQHSGIVLIALLLVPPGTHEQQTTATSSSAATEPAKPAENIDPPVGYLALKNDADDAAPECPAEFNDSPETNGVTHVNFAKREGHATPPKLTHSVDAEFSEEARKAAKKKFLRRFKGTSIVSLIVDSKGQPHEVCVRKLAGFGLDEEAVKAVRQWSFAPAKLNDAPIAVRINVVVQFRTY